MYSIDLAIVYAAVYRLFYVNWPLSAETVAGIVMVLDVILSNFLKCLIIILPKLSLPSQSCCSNNMYILLVQLPCYPIRSGQCDQTKHLHTISTATLLSHQIRAM